VLGVVGKESGGPIYTAMVFSGKKKGKKKRGCFAFIFLSIWTGVGWEKLWGVD